MATGQQALLYWDFVSHDNELGSIQVNAHPRTHQNLSSSIGLGHKRQYTPDTESLNGLFALEVSLQVVRTVLGVQPPTFFMLRDIYRSVEFRQAAQGLSRYASNAITAAQLLWDLTSTTNLTCDAMRLVLACYARLLQIRLRLGVLSKAADPAGSVWNAVEYDELIPLSTPTSDGLTIWVADDNQHGTANQPMTTFHWSGLAPQALYAVPRANIASPQLSQEEVDASNIAEPPIIAETSPAGPDLQQTPRKDSSADSSTPTTDDSDDRMKIRTEYPSHLTEEEVLDKYPHKLMMENLLYVLRRYKQSELLEQLKQRHVDINSEALRQRKKSALKNRTKVIHGPEATLEQYNEVSRHYNAEILRAGWYEPRLMRGESKFDHDGKGRGQSEGRNVHFTHPNLPKSPSVDVSNTANPFSSDIEWQAPVVTPRPFYRSSSIGSHTSNEGSIKLPSRRPRVNKKHRTKPDFILECMQPALWLSDVDKRQATVEMELDSVELTTDVTDDDLATILQREIAVMDAAAAASDDAPTSSNNRQKGQPSNHVLAGQALANFFLRAHPHSDGQPDPQARNGRGVGPPGSTTWFRWPTHRQPPTLTLEQIDWYFKDGREKWLVSTQIEQLHGMRKNILDEIWYRNHAITAEHSIPEAIEISSDVE